MLTKSLSSHYCVLSCRLLDDGLSTSWAHHSLLPECDTTPGQRSVSSSGYPGVAMFPDVVSTVLSVSILGACLHAGDNFMMGPHQSSLSVYCPITQSITDCVFSPLSLHFASPGVCKIADLINTNMVVHQNTLNYILAVVLILLTTVHLCLTRAEFQPKIWHPCWLYFLSERVINALGEVFPSVQAVVQGVFLGCSPGHLQAGEASGPVALRVHCHHPTQPTYSGLHVGQA